MKDAQMPGDTKDGKDKPSGFAALAEAYDKSISKAVPRAVARLPLIGKPMAELEQALCNAGIGVRSLFPTECAETDDIVGELRKQVSPVKNEDRGSAWEASAARSNGSRRQA